MKEKIKFMTIVKGKTNKSNMESWKKVIERYAPDMYDMIFVTGEEESIKQVGKLRPEIIVIDLGNQHKPMDALGLLKKIKQLHPPAPILIILGMVNDEQETIDEFMAYGAYKCYLPPIVVDTLIHDMYVALNLE